MNVRQLGDIGRLVVVEHGEVAVARLEGEVDLSNAESLVRQLKHAVEPAAAGLVVDLSSAEYIDSAGIRGLFEIHRHLTQRRQELGLVVGGTSVLRTVLEATGVPHAMPLHEDVESAIAAVRSRHRDPRDPPLDG